MKKDLTNRHCEAGVYCFVCRSREGGRAWRVSLASVCGSPGSPDFECPRGQEWGYRPPERETVKQEPEPPFVSARIAACTVCDEGACFLKRMLTTKPCAFRARIVRPGMLCPLERWPTEQAVKHET